MKVGEKNYFSWRLPVGRFWGMALVVAFVFGTLWVSPVQAETNTGGCYLTITAHKFEDKNGDGDQDSGEPNLNNWSFTLTYPNGSTTSGTTNSNGNKTFYTSSCATGTYTLTETLQSGWYNTTPTSQQWTYNGGTQSKSWTANFGNAKYSKITVKKFEDKNGDGSKGTGEGWLNGWNFTVYDSNGNQVASGSTSGSGSVNFGSLVSGTYTVTETVQTGYLPTTSGGATQTVVLGYDQTQTVTFGNARLAEICVYKFEDSDGDGQKDEGEPYLPGWTFTLYDSQNNQIASGVTNENGKVSFWVFVPYNQSKTFKAVETPQAGYYPTTPTEQTTTSVSYGGWAELFFGNAPYGSIKVTKFEDLNGDGDRDDGEPFLPDWEFELVKDNQSIANGTTGQDGTLVFDELEAASYTVTEVIPDDYFPTTNPSQATTVAPGQQVELIFGNQRYDMDYGDLPDDYGMTLFSEDGARHKPLLCLANEQDCDVRLGVNKDNEYDGNPHNAATGDDGHNQNDEDGVVRGTSWGGGTGTITVTVSGGQPACLTAWVDYFDLADQDFGFDHQFTESFSYNSQNYSERVIDNEYLDVGTHGLTFTLPPDFGNTTVFARFRLVPALFNGQNYHCDRALVEPTGLEMGGEVEDYYWQFGPTAVELRNVRAAPQQAAGGLGLAAFGLVLSLSALWVGRRRRK
ncbi:MAG: hypothetical protein ANABAC_0100 [Anaerolineae bacterium]|nr:MAG: hypothetical protein ANABAC_0100 [Anaerolineae bacterium]